MVRPLVVLTESEDNVFDVMEVCQTMNTFTMTQSCMQLSILLPPAGVSPDQPGFC